MKNKFTESQLLINEASVEDLFASRLIRDLGYADADILHKASITPVEVRLGSKKVRYAPDYVLKVNGKPRVVIDAKGPGENVMSWVGQCVSYCATINRRHRKENPIGYFMLTNGMKTVVFEVDQGEPLIEVDFKDCKDGNVKYEQLKKILAPGAVVKAAVDGSKMHQFFRHRIEGVNAVFSWCHQHIYRKDNLSQAAGFEEFVKLVFLKLLSDRQIRDKFPSEYMKDKFEVPEDAVKFSVRWIESREEDDPHPLDSVQFKGLLGTLENEIRTNRKKRIFRENSRINLHAGTVKEVVRRLENVYLFGIDADLNGRLFETFLSATMRGKDLGQFFTPRSVAKMGTLLANPKVSKGSFEVVLDGCCGTGGFLIDVLADMWAKVDANNTLSATEKEKLKKQVAEEAIYGVDSAQEPNLARLARMNMYLHGDGGSSIYEADFLDKEVSDPSHADAEVRAEVSQLRDLLQKNPDGFAHVVVTNPPFAKIYERKTPREDEILKRYDLATNEEKLKSSLMFFERYYDVLKPGGRLVSVIDDGILSGTTFVAFRAYLRDRFVVRAVVSLPGDAFQRSQARVKTSFVVLVKRDPKAEEPEAQGPVFRYACRYVGIDDPNRQRTLPIDAQNRRMAKEEIATVSSLYREFEEGRPISDEHLIAAEALSDRLDAKSYEPTGRMLATWAKDGVRTEPLDSLIEPVATLPEDLINGFSEDEAVTYLVVGYDGFAREGETINLSEQKAPPRFERVHTGQIIVSHINAVNGSICVVPEHLDGLVITVEFTAFQAKEGYDPRVIWALMRSPEIRSEFLIRARGAGRTRVHWPQMKEIRVPIPSIELATQVVGDLIKAEEELRAAQRLREEAQALVERQFGLASEKARATLAAFKPPE